MLDLAAACLDACEGVARPLHSPSLENLEVMRRKFLHPVLRLNHNSALFLSRRFPAPFLVAASSLSIWHAIHRQLLESCA
jgi:hypothetical protein